MTAIAPIERTIDLSAGAFRGIEWPGNADRTVVFLHGLSGVADVWTDTIADLADALGVGHPRCIAIDQRNHGHSPRTPGHCTARDYLADLVELIEGLGTRVDLVGHSMGARVTILAAARRPDLVDTATIVDIGPEAWSTNVTNTARSFRALPERFVDRAEALEFGRLSNRGDQWAERFVAWRLRPHDDGSYTWLADHDRLIESVATQRARNYWHDWERIATPALLIRGGTSREVRPRIAAEMRRRNPRVGFVEIADVGHNVPLLAPRRLADELAGFWTAR